MRTGRQVISDAVKFILAHGFTPAKLAVACGVSERTVYAWKAGSSMPRGHQEAVIFQIMSGIGEDAGVEGGR